MRGKALFKIRGINAAARFLLHRTMLSVGWFAAAMFSRGNRKAGFIRLVARVGIQHHTAVAKQQQLRK